METYRVTTRYISAWYTVVLPTAIALLVWAGVFLIPMALMGWTVPGWLGMLLCLGGFIPGLAAAVLSYRLLLRLAERGRGNWCWKVDRLRWRKGAAGGRWTSPGPTKPPSRQLQRHGTTQRVHYAPPRRHANPPPGHAPGGCLPPLRRALVRG